MAHLDEILAANERRDASTAPRMPWTARRELCIITCVDPRLMRFFPTALGLERGDAVIIRIPGANVLVGHGDGLRSVAAAAYINKATEFIVLGHTDCGTTKVETGAVLAEMQKRGVSAESMPGGPREFLGAVSDLHAALKASAAAIRGAPFLPRDLLVHAAIIDIESGALEIVERGENFQDASAAGGSVGYTPGRASSLGSGLGDGMGLLSSSSIGSLFDGGSALASNKDPFAGLSSQLPPGWSSGSSALAPSSAASGSGPVDLSSSVGASSLASSSAPVVPSTMPSVSQLPTPTPLTMPGVPPVSAPQVSIDISSPPPQRPQAAPPPVPKKKAPPARRAPKNSEFDANVAKVRDFYRLNFSLDQRKTIARTLAKVARENRGSGEMAKVVIKPILDLGQKRYKVIDEVIAIKEQAASLDPDDALELLSRLFD